MHQFEIKVCQGRDFYSEIMIVLLEEIHGHSKIRSTEEKKNMLRI